MSNYCTNCKWLGKETLSNHTTWLCKRENSIGYMLQSLCGNPKRAWRCKDENWYESKNKSEVHKLVTEHGRAMQFVTNEILKQQEKKMTTEEMIRVMQAYVDGKQIEVTKRGEGKGYQPLCDAIWDFVNYHYRIKPEPKYRPLKPEELVELKGKWLLNKGDKCLYTVVYIKPFSVGIVANREYDPEQLLKYWTYEDGTPCGKLEE